MEPRPTNEHEREIAKIIEARCKRNECSYEGGLLEVSRTVGFTMSESDVKYLIAFMEKNCLVSTQSLSTQS
jgi:hypothetical protein